MRTKARPGTWQIEQPQQTREAQPALPLLELLDKAREEELRLAGSVLVGERTRCRKELV